MSDQNKPQVNLDKKQLQRKYKEAVQYLDDNYAYFLTHVLKIGKPEWTHAMDTAAVMLDLDDKNSFLPGGKKNSTDLDYDEFKFIFNPQFAATLDTETMAFILAHETMHILLNHLKLSGNFVDRDVLSKGIKAQEKGKRLTKDEIRDLLIQQQNAMRFNIAADCVINDYLANAGFKVDGITLYDDKGNKLGGAMRGKEQVGTDCANLTVTEVYEMLEQQARKMKGQCQTCGGTGQKPKDDQKQQGGKGDKDQKDGDKQDQQGNGSGDQQQDQNGQGGQPDQNHQHGDKGEPCPDCQGSGKGQGMGVGGSYRQMDNHGWMLDPDFADQLADAIDKLNDEVDAQQGLPGDLDDKKTEEDGKQSERQKQLAKAMQPGTQDGNMQEFVEQTGVNLAWAKLLRDVDPDIFKEPGIAPPLLPSFHQRRRKMNHPALKRAALPVYKRETRMEKETNEKPAIVMALDTSGSIGPRDAARFVSLAKTIPQERVKLFIITFTTVYRELDLDNPRYSSGGTDFTCIGQYIHEKVQPELKGQYPKAVVVITDGAAGMHNYLPDDEQKEHWLWLISPSDYSSYGPAGQWGTKKMLDEYID